MWILARQRGGKEETSRRASSRSSTLREENAGEGCNLQEKIRFPSSLSKRVEDPAAGRRRRGNPNTA
ncbi:hypothetical protein M0802_004426 [Mischocyttarus mexicanus]|nr:hypothetical protein M0802_004426 [Mischocyttarus mexicanus]